MICFYCSFESCPYTIVLHLLIIILFFLFFLLSCSFAAANLTIIVGYVYIAATDPAMQRMVEEVKVIKDVERPRGISVTREGHIVVVTWDADDRSSVHVFTNKGQ